ncbi:PREDICTED: platelet-activating factor acetylhydrolase 2, cytoplasmic [Pygoscelis adeliae]|uniref:platelet-activating factor acetylhydrolase 2, cytoplasmic n=1 Tax=Pygoscelis adeliae TaxID=9238 RepID=UPI0004F4F078|nr:PREDICTED: platelet-activating factor acetylhydrolase 2, cytoplasmic [Pygoscelis adeliae]
MVGHTRQGLFLRLFYPCLPRAGAERPLWIPRYEYCGGLADFAHCSRRWCAPLLSVAIGSCRVPVSWNGPFKPCSGGDPLITFFHRLEPEWGAGCPGPPVVPLGLALRWRGSPDPAPPRLPDRTLYSSVCSELASWGFAVAALEHRDHSASVTYFCTVEAGREEWIPYRRVPQGQKEFYFRNKQVHQRAEECVRALRLFEDISSGKSVPNVLHQDFDLSVLKDSIDLTKVAVMGHSFGGVTAVLALVKEPGFRCAVALDAWMFPLENALYPEVPKPVLFINTEKFQTPECRGSVHQSQTDFTFLTGKLISRIFGARGTLDPYKCLDITSWATLAFLQRHLDLEEEFDQWDKLLEGIGDSVVPEAPFCRSNL